MDNNKKIKVCHDIRITILYYLLSIITLGLQAQSSSKIKFFNASHPWIQYTGRIDFSDKSRPRFWSPGVYIQARFKGPSCQVILTDEVLYGSYHNYIEIIIDEKASRVKLKNRTDTLTITGNKFKIIHDLIICKNTESGIGYLEFRGLRCESLSPPVSKPKRKIEFIGNSITCGMSSDLSSIPCDAGQWYDQHNAWLSYGAITARALKADWHLTAVSGIGLIHSCCNMTIVMPQVFDKINLRTDSIRWNFSNYQPDVVTICLGQNDGIQDSAIFCSAYVKFIKKLRGYYPKATIICLTSPMADPQLTLVLKKYLSSIVASVNQSGDKKVYNYFFQKRYYHGCGSHPDLEEHRQMAGELKVFIRKTMQW